MLYTTLFLKNLVNVQALAHFKNKLHKQPSPIIQESGMSGVSKRGELKVLERRHFTNFTGSDRSLSDTFTSYVAVTVRIGAQKYGQFRGSKSETQILVILGGQASPHLTVETQGAQDRGQDTTLRRSVRGQTFLHSLTRSH